MCGFLGVSNKDFFLSREKIIISSFDWLKHRGPDESKKLLLENFFIGFHRLSIVGINNNSALQPIKLGNKNLYLIFNGEIYNFKKVAKERLNDSDINPKDLNSDTLVLSALIKKFGIKSLNWLDGMFSIALVDDDNRELTLDME